MNKPKGGRGRKAPYEQTHIRVPIPIKGLVQSIIDDYRAKALGEELKTDKDGIESGNIQVAIDLVERFIADTNISQESIDKPTRNNISLRRFIDWLKEHQ